MFGLRFSPYAKRLIWPGHGDRGAEAPCGGLGQSTEPYGRLSTFTCGKRSERNVLGLLLGNIGLRSITDVGHRHFSMRQQQTKKALGPFLACRAQSPRLFLSLLSLLCTCILGMLLFTLRTKRSRNCAFHHACTPKTHFSTACYYFVHA